MPWMRILTVNAGSTSLKVETYDVSAPLPDLAAPPLPARVYGAAESADFAGEAFPGDIDVVAHRFVAVPAGASAVFRLDAAGLEALDAVASDAPLHDAAALRAVRALRAARPDVPQVAVSDSAFHRTMSRAASTYAIPRALTAKGLRRVGYHGLSHQYAAHRAAALARIDVHASRIVTLHLGGGSSLCAIRDGRSIDTSMGFTPLEGLPMATRSGSLDPGLILHLLRGGMTVDELDDMLEHRSGLAGISGRTGDVRELLAVDDDDARLAIDVLGWRLRAALGAMIAVLGGVDLVAFTGGIGENAPVVRAAALRGAAAWGAVLDDERNHALSGEGPLGPDGARVPAYVVAARENWLLARSAFRFESGARQ